ncbi:MAG: hypothetical protein RIR21_919 [Pseudomonadota bacterium]
MQNYAAETSNNAPIGLVLGQWINKLVSPQRTKVTTITDRVTNTRTLINLAREVEQSQPNLAAEFRNFASRS